jgi:hypothetical protein
MDNKNLRLEGEGSSFNRFFLFALRTGEIGYNLLVLQHQFFFIRDGVNVLTLS